MSNRVRAWGAAAATLVALASCSSPGTKVGLSSHKSSAAHNGPIAYERFTGQRDDHLTAQIYLRSPDGMTRRLTDVKGGAFAPAWSFDGSRIAFEGGAAGHRHEIFVMNPDGSGLRQLTHGCAVIADCAGDSSPAWSPDGGRVSFFRLHGPIVDIGDKYEQIVAAAGVDLLVAGSDGHGERVVKRWAADPQPPPGRSRFGWTDPGAPVWSPDGKQIAVALGSRRHPNKHAAFNTALHVVDVSDGAERQITPWVIGAGNPSWSRDGKHIAFNSWGGHSPNLYVVEPDGHDLRLVLRGNTTSSHIGWVATPVWSPDGKQIAFGTQTLPCHSLRAHGCARDPDFTPFDLYEIDADGLHLRRLTSAPQFESHPAWGPAR